MAILYHFAVTGIQYTLCQTGITIVATTDTDCHLYLRWTYQLPLIHLDPFIRRGAAVGTRPRFCFDVYSDLEQQERGDSYTHTWVIPSWASCQTRYFYFWGCKEGYLIPSESCIFEFHKPMPMSQIIRPDGVGIATGIPFVYPPGSPHWYVQISGCGSYVRASTFGCSPTLCTDYYTIDNASVPHICTVTFKGLGSTTGYGINCYYHLYHPTYGYWQSARCGISHSYCAPTLDIITTLNPFTSKPWLSSDFVNLQLGVSIQHNSLIGNTRWHQVYMLVEGYE